MNSDNRAALIDAIAKLCRRTRTGVSGQLVANVAGGRTLTNGTLNEQLLSAALSRGWCARKEVGANGRRADGPSPAQHHAILLRASTPSPYCWNCCSCGRGHGMRLGRPRVRRPGLLAIRFLLLQARVVSPHGSLLVSPGSSPSFTSTGRFTTASWRGRLFVLPLVLGLVLLSGVFRRKRAARARFTGDLLGACTAVSSCSPPSACALLAGEPDVPGAGGAGCDPKAAGRAAPGGLERLVRRTVGPSCWRSLLTAGASRRRAAPA